MSAENKPVVRFDKEENYKEFERQRGFDIRTHNAPQEDDVVKLEYRFVRYPAKSTEHGQPNFTSTRVQDSRDNRDPQQFGDALLSRPPDISITDYADMIGEVK